MTFVQHLIRKPTIALAFMAFTVCASAAAVACSSGEGGLYAGAEPTPAVTAPSSPDASPVSINVDQSDLGAFLTAPNGNTLYVFTVDVPNTSNCKDDCLVTWPPLLIEDGQTIEADSGADGEFDSISTPSGEQVTFNGAPLYFYAGDDQPGETNGHLVGGVWFVARPDTASTAVVGVRGADDTAHLIGPDGMTLYVFANDTAGVSNCAGQCLANQPALTVPDGQAPTAVDAADGSLDVITRTDDGTRQITYNELPLYFFAGDSLPGDTKGEGVGGVWSVARPTNTPAPASLPTTQSKAPAAQPTLAPPPVAAPSPVLPPTVAPEPTKAAPARMPYEPPRGGNGYGY